MLLPDSSQSSLRILRSSKQSRYTHFEKVWDGVGFYGEPLVDSARLQREDILSVFVVTDSESSPSRRDVVVADFNI